MIIAKGPVSMTDTSPTPWLQVLWHRGLFQQPSLLFLPEAVRVTLNIDHMTVMEQPVQNRAGPTRLPEDRSPLTKAWIGRQDDGPPLIAARDEREEHMGAVPIDGDIAQLSDHEERWHGIELQAVLNTMVGIGCRQSGAAREHRGQQRSVPLLDRLQAQPNGHMGFPRPSGTQEHASLAVIEEAPGGQVLELLAIDRRLQAIVKAL